MTKFRLSSYNFIGITERRKAESVILFTFLKRWGQNDLFVVYLMRHRLLHWMYNVKAERFLVIEGSKPDRQQRIKVPRKPIFLTTEV